MSAKGGVGKTSIAVNITNFCAHYGMKILLIDCDLRTHGATAFLRINKNWGISKNIISFQTILQNTVDNQEIKDEKTACIRDYKPVFIETNFYFIPALLEMQEIDMRDFEQKYLQKMKEEFNEMLMKWKTEYELIIFDLGAGSDSLNDYLSSISNHICFIAENGNVSIDAVQNCTNKMLIAGYGDKIVGCFNRLKQGAEKLPSRRGFAFDEIAGFADMADYKENMTEGNSWIWQRRIMV